MRPPRRPRLDASNHAKRSSESLPRGPHSRPSAEELFHAALAVPPAEREAFLTESREGDEELLAEVRELLALHADAKRLLDEPVAEAATQPVGLTKGTRLGHYEVAELIDAGGMGEVYRARDTKLERDVAIKVLPVAFSREAERVSRLAREARLLAALNHPNIEAIHGIEEFDGRHALVLELVPGETLADRIARGALGVPEAIELARQMAEALEAAHEKGILHRDIKPANVKLTPDGRVKLLDFGLAKALTTLSDEEQPQRHGTTDGTRSGLILGTARYMSPEQAQGQPLDERTDIWSFGAVLFEMLSGKRAFAGETTSEILASVIKDEPPWQELGRACPAAVARLLRRCLRKHPRERLHAIADVRIELDELLSKTGTEEGGAETDQPATGTQSARQVFRLWWIWALLVSTLLFGGVATQWWRPSEPPQRPVLRSQIELTPGRPLLGRTHFSSRTELAVSPDGTRLVWVSDPAPDPSMAPSADAALEMRRLDTGESTRLQGTEGASQPFFSPDGRWIGFFAWDDGQWHVRKVRVEGGLPIELGELPAEWSVSNQPGWPSGGTWSADGTILLGRCGTARGIIALPSEGGPARQITSVDPSREVGHLLPHALPGGRALLFTALPHFWGVRSRVEAISLATGARRVVVEDAADARYLRTGHLVFGRRGVLMAAPFDAERLEFLAAPVPVIPAVSQSLNTGSCRQSGALQLATSDTGLLVYAAGGIYTAPPNRLLVVDEAQAPEPLPGFDKPLLSPQLHLSPDGRRLAFVEQGLSGLAWTFDLERRTYTALSRTGIASAPRWSPDGDRIAMAWSEAGPLSIWLLPADGRGDWEHLVPNGMAPSWSPDGQFLAFCKNDDILLYRFADHRVEPFVTGEGDQRYPEFSPDGRWLAYTSDETGRQDVYITSFPGRERTLTVSDSRGSGPIWSRDGRRLYYRARSVPGDPTSGRVIMAVDLRAGPTLSLGRPVRLLELPPGSTGVNPMRFQEILPNGRFLVAIREQQEPSPRITHLEVVHNWHQELLKLAPIQ